jgi:hypothetical protein
MFAPAWSADRRELAQRSRAVRISTPPESRTKTLEFIAFMIWNLKLAMTLLKCRKNTNSTIHRACTSSPRRWLAVSDSTTMCFSSTLVNKSTITKELKSCYESRSGWILDLFGEVAESLERVRNCKVWQDGNHPEILNKKKFINQKLEYLHYNPVMDEIVSRPEDYLYSSARDYYCNEKGLLELNLI